MIKNKSIVVQDKKLSLISQLDKDYISLTDIAKSKDDDVRAADIIKNWIRNRGTIEFLGTWEIFYNPNFKVVEFDHFKKEAGLPTFTMSVNNWVEKTSAIGIFSKYGKYGGTYAHLDIALEFSAAISPVFKLHLIKEYQRLKEIESNQYNLEWNIKRVLSKVNYQFHTEAIKNYIIPKSGLAHSKEGIAYVDEADMLNLALFGCTAKEWREANMSKHLQGENIRDMASINELTILTNLENTNAKLIKEGMDKTKRLEILKQEVKEQRATIDKLDLLKSIKKENDGIYVSSQKYSKIENKNKKGE